MATELFGSHLVANPRGREYSYLVTMTGCPFAWSDGKAAWTAPDGQTVLRGGLGSTDWTFDLTADPLSPLDIGGGLTVELVDESSRATRLFFAPNYSGGGYTRLSAPVTATDTTLTVYDTSPFSPNDIVHIGLEAAQVLAVASATALTVIRGRWGSVPRRHSVYKGETATAGPRVALSPREHRGRFLSIWITPIQDDGTLSSAAADMYKVWAGRVATVSFEGGSVKVSCESLLASMTRDDWPPLLPTGSFGKDAVTFHLTAEQQVIELALSNGTDTKILPTSRWGYFDIGDTWTELSAADGYFTLAQIGRYLTDTIIKACIDDSWLWGAIVKNHLSVAVVEMENGRQDLVATVSEDGVTNGLHIFGLGGPLLDALGTPGGRVYFQEENPGSFSNWRGFAKTGLFLSATNNQVEYIPTSSTFPLTTSGCYNGTAWVGFARIYSGGAFELISFTGEQAGDSTNRRRLTGVKRGLGGTSARAWGNDPVTAEDEGGGEVVSIDQVWMEDYGTSLRVDKFLIPPLVSTGVVNSNSTYDQMGADMGMGIPSDFVDLAGIEGKIGMLGLPAPRTFWVTDSKSGKGDMTSFLQANGLFFVARRFLSGGRNLFGISVDTVEAASRSSYQGTLTDADRSANTSVSLSFNERLIVNAIRVSPYWKYRVSAEEEGGFEFVTAEESIADYGLSKSLDIKPSAMYSLLSAGGFRSTNAGDIYVAIATLIGFRWFGSYANGNYVLTLETPHTGWRFSPGQVVQLTLTGVTAADGGDGLGNVTGRVMSIKQRHGRNPGATIEVRLAYADMSELAPCMRATAVDGTGTVLTVSSNVFSSSLQPIPYAPLDTGGAGTLDSYWFDASEHGGSLSVFCWEVGAYANGQARTITTTAHAGLGSTITLSAALSAGLQAAATAGTLVITFDNYATASALSRLFAYIGSNAIPSLLNSTDEAPRLA